MRLFVNNYNIWRNVKHPKFTYTTIDNVHISYRNLYTAVSNDKI